MSNPWTLDLAKLIVPNVFIDVEFIRVLAQSYHPATRSMRFPDGSPLVVLTKAAIIECFDLNKQALSKIDL